ncbi:hypothetical protein PIL02S_06678 [Paenibacillus illinoisensis]|uniref:Uncharacterized protein n=1 Tax=Paenibacillus illinoisensis TaxID=59845 RepID=A0A2W0C0B0_9BACL|nr:hypothetical protein PIL02S_06678 [Paenibacillus illinoisensis]
MLISALFMFKTDFQPTKNTLTPFEAYRVYDAENALEQPTRLWNLLIFGRRETRIFLKHFAEIWPVGSKTGLLGER